MDEPNRWDDSRTLTERAEEDLSWAGLAVAGTLRLVEVAVIALLTLAVVPPLLILAVVVVVPAVALAAVVALVALPVMIVRHVHVHRAEHAHHRVRRLAALGRERAEAASSGVHRGMARALAKLAHE